MHKRDFLVTMALSVPALALGRNISFNGSSHKRTGEGFVIKHGESRFGEKTLLGPSPNDIKVSSKDTNGLLTIFEYTGNAKGGPPLHIHPNQDEIFLVSEGNYLFQLGEVQHKLSAGDTIFLPRNIPHTWAQLTDNGKLKFLFQPSGKMEDFFRTLSDLKREPTMEEGSKIFQDHDMKIVGPPLKFE